MYVRIKVLSNNDECERTGIKQSFRSSRASRD